MAIGIPGMDVREPERYPDNIRNPRVVGGVSPQGAAWQAQQAGNVASQAATDARAAARLGGVAAAPVTPATPAVPVAPAAPVAPQSLAGRAWGTTKTLARGGGRLTGALGYAADAAAEGADVYRVAKDPNATGIDVATQAAEGVGRFGAGAAGGLAGLKAGAALGAVGGPIGAAVGGAIGGGLGYVGGRWLGDGIIKQHRVADDVDPTSPVDRTAQGSVRADLTRAALGGPVSTGTGASIDRTAPAAAAAPSPAPAAPPSLRDQVYAENGAFNPNVVVRQGNSYSGGNVGPNMQMYDRAGSGQLSLREAAGGYVGTPTGPGAAPAPSVSDRVASYEREAQLYRDIGRLNAEASLAQSGTPGGGQAFVLGTPNGMFRNDQASLRDAFRGDSPRTQRFREQLAAEQQTRQAELRQRAASEDRADARARYSADQSLRSTIYTVDSNARAAATKAQSDDAIRQNTLDQGNYDAVRKQHMQYAKDTKTGAMVEDTASTDRLIRAMDKVIPGYTTMSAAARAKHSGEAEALMSLYNRTKGGDKNGVFEALFGNDGPQRDSLPDFSGGELRQEGLTGALLGGAGARGYYWRQPNGQELQLGKDLTENEINLLTEMGKKKKG